MLSLSSFCSLSVALGTSSLPSLSSRPILDLLLFSTISSDNCDSSILHLTLSGHPVGAIGFPNHRLPMHAMQWPLPR